jgi:hypothetical protein
MKKTLTKLEKEAGFDETLEEYIKRSEEIFKKIHRG